MAGAASPASGETSRRWRDELRGAQRGVEEQSGTEIGWEEEMRGEDREEGGRCSDSSSAFHLWGCFGGEKTDVPCFGAPNMASSLSFLPVSGLIADGGSLAASVSTETELSCEAIAAAWGAECDRLVKIITVT